MTATLSVNLRGIIALPRFRKLMLGLVLALACQLTMAPSARAQAPGRVDPTFGASLGLAGFSETVALTSDQKILIGGYFPRGIARINADGSRDLSFDPGTGANGPVSVLLIQPDGKALIGGAFTSVNGTARTALARINVNGSLDASFAADVNGTVRALALQTDGKILVGGSFSTVGGVTRANVARLLPSGGADSTFNPGLAPDNEVDALLVQPEGSVVLGGLFNNVNGAAHGHLALVDATGQLSTAFTASANGNVFALARQSDGKLIAAGDFSTVNGAAPGFVARLLPGGATDTGFNPAVNNTVGSLYLQPDGALLLYGTFTKINGIDRSNIARLHPDGTLDTGLDSGISGLPIPSINAYSDPLVRADATGQIYVAPYGYPQRLNADGSIDDAFKPDAVPGPNALVTSVDLGADGKLLVAGNFTIISGNRRLGAGRLNADGSFDPSFDPGLNGLNFAVKPQADGKVLVGRAPSTVNGVTRNGLVRLDASGTLDPSFTSGVSGSFTALKFQPDGKILTEVDLSGAGIPDIQPNTVVRLLASGAEDTAFTRAVVNGAFATYTGALTQPVLQSNGSVLVCGAFISVNNVFRVGLARLSSAGALDTSFQPTFGGPFSGYGLVYATAVQSDGKIVVGGDFTRFIGSGNPSRNNVARLTASGALDTAFNPGTGTNGDVNAVAIQPDGKILIVGQFTTVNGTARPGVARLNTDGSLDTAFNPGTGISGGTLQAALGVTLQTDGKVIVAGDFTAFNGVVRNYVARLNTDGSVDKSFNPGLGAPSVAALAYRPDDQKIIVGGSFTSAGGQPINALSRLNPDGSVDPGFNAGFVPGDTVQTLLRQPGNGAIVAAAIVTDTSPFSRPSRLARQQALAVRPGTRRPAPGTDSKIKNPIVRLSGVDGGPDTSFFADANTDGVTYSLSLQSADGKILVAGSFSQLNDTVGHPNIGRLNTDGTLDVNFAPTANGTVQAVLAQADGRIVLGGIFTQVNGTARARLARLSADGTLDSTFNALAGTDGPVATLKQQSDGRLLVGGTFAIVNAAVRSCLARLNADGTLDPSFNAGTISYAGSTALISSIDQQPDGKLIVAGLFDHIGSVTRNKVARLNTDGSVDTSYDPGSGPDAIVRAVALQPDGKTLLGGDFTTVDDNLRSAAARLLGNYDLNAYPALGQWRIINFGTPDNAGDAADTAIPFGDGVPNLVKFALNLNARAADATPMTASGSKGLPLAARANGRLSLTFVRRQAGTAPGITYGVEFGNVPGGPGSFAPNPAATVSEPVMLDATWERVTVTDSANPAQPARFARLKITNP